MCDLDAEFWRAIQRSREPGAAAVLHKLTLRRHVQWGLSPVRTRGMHYEPADDGNEFAIIAPMVWFGDLVDLCAVVLPSGAPCTRVGVGEALGWDEIDRARWEMDTLRLVERPLQWLAEPRGCACIIDWSRARSTLDQIGKVTCNSVALGRRVRHAFELPPLLAPLVEIEL